MKISADKRNTLIRLLTGMALFAAAFFLFGKVVVSAESGGISAVMLSDGKKVQKRQ